MQYLTVFLAVIFAANGNSKTIPSSKDGRKIVCRFDLQFRESPHYFNMDEYKSNLCTHAVLTHGAVHQELGLFYENTVEMNYYNQKALSEIRSRDDILKLLAMDPVATRLEYNQVQMIDTEIGRSRLVQGAIDVLREGKLDGIEVKVRFSHWNSTVKLLSKMREEFEKEGLLLSALLPPFWEIKNMTQPDPIVFPDSINLDFWSIQSFMTKKGGSEQTELMAPLYANTEFSVNASISSYVSMGIPREKIVMGIPTIAVVHRLRIPDETGISSQSSEEGHLYTLQEKPGRYRIVDPSLYNLYQCFKNQTHLWILHRDELSGAPFASNLYNWVSYEDETSVRGKANYIIEQGLGGAMVWTLDRDNFEESFPIASLLNHILLSSEY